MFTYAEFHENWTCSFGEITTNVTNKPANKLTHVMTIAPIADVMNDSILSDFMEDSSSLK